MALCWGGTTVAARYVAPVLPPLTAGWLRYLFALVLLVPLLLRREGRFPRLDRRQLVATLALGVTGVLLFNLFFFAALQHIEAGRAALVVALNTVFTAIAMTLFFGERMRRARALGIALALLGAWIVIQRGDLASLAAGGVGVGELYMLIGILSWTAYGLLARFAVKGLSSLAATTYAALWGWLMLGAFAAPDLVRTDWAAVPPAVLGALAYMGLIGTALAFLWYYEGIMRLGPARSAVFMNLVPIFSVVLAASLLGEPILASMLVGGALVVAGVMLTNRS
jgi:drug/metabolite transporter (DMT)-like permease